MALSIGGRGGVTRHQENQQQKKSENGQFAIQFGGRNGMIGSCLSIPQLGFLHSQSALIRNG